MGRAYIRATPTNKHTRRLFKAVGAGILVAALVAFSVASTLNVCGFFFSSPLFPHFITITTMNIKTEICGRECNQEQHSCSSNRRSNRNGCGLV